MVTYPSKLHTQPFYESYSNMGGGLQATKDVAKPNLIDKSIDYNLVKRGEALKTRTLLHKVTTVSSIFALAASLLAPSASLASPDISQQILSELTNEVLQEPTYISPNLDTSSSKDVRVIVQLSSDPVAVERFSAGSLRAFSTRSAESSIKSEQTSFEELARKQGISLQVNYRYNTVLNGMEVTVAADKIPALAKLPGVKSVHENQTYFTIPVQDPSTVADDTYEVKFDNAPLDLIGAPEAWSKGFTGKGLKVGVIDTGVDYNHPDLKDAYKGGYDSFEQDNDPYEEPPVSIDEDPYGTGFAGTSHGTHVAGTIVGQAKNTTSDIVQKGVAYDADLYAYKVLGRNPATGRSSGSSAQVIDGIERAVKDGMDVINLSLGSDQEKDPNSPDSIAINNAVLSGVVAVIASGNAADSGPYYYSMGSPASAQLAISVGATTIPGRLYTAAGTVSQATYESVDPNGSVTADTYDFYDYQLMGWRTGDDDFASILGTHPIEVVYADLGQVDDYVGKDVTGKIVLLSRGSLAFVDKIEIAKEQGALAAIIFNGNTSPSDPNSADLSDSVAQRDGYINTSLGDSLGFIPTFDMKGREGRAWARSIVENPDKLHFITFDQEYPQIDVPGDRMASFSSRGPNSDDLLGIKPDVSAPGVNIMSTWPKYGKFDPDASYAEAYNRSNGTSMASPHVAGLALLLKQQHPDWTPFDVRAALANTADSLFNESGKLYDAYSQGAGRVNVDHATDTPALLQTVEQLTILDKDLTYRDVINYGSSASFGVLPAGSEAKQIQLQLKNVSSSSVRYQASVELHADVTSDPTNPISTPSPSNIRVELQGVGDGGAISADAGKSQPFFLSVQPVEGAVDGVYEGKVVLESTGRPTLHLPFTVHVGEKAPATGFGLQEMQLSNPIITPNRGGIKATTDVTFRLTAENTDYIELQVYGVNDQLIGIVDNIYTEEGFLEPGDYAFENYGGTYFAVDEAGSPQRDANGNLITRQLTAGTYKLTLIAPQLDANGNFKYNADGLMTYYASKALRVDTSRKSSSSDDTTGGNNGNSSTGGGGGGTPPTTPATDTPATPADGTTPSAPSIQGVVKQGQSVQPVQASVVVSNGIQALSITNEALQAALNEADSKPVAIVVSINTSEAPTTKLILSADQLGLLAKSTVDSSIILNFGTSSLSLPTSALSSVPAGSSLELNIADQDQDLEIFTKGFPGATIIGTPVSFEVNVLSGNLSTPLNVPAKERILRSFTVPGQIEGNTAGVLYTSGSKVSPTPSVFNKQDDGTTVVVVNRPGLSTYAVATRTVYFEDISSSFAQSQIQSLAHKLLINGTSEQTFAPKERVTRAEFAAMLTRSLGLQAANTAPFTDVQAGGWYAGDVAAAYNAGLITGRNDGKFDPNAHITRQEMSVMLSKAMDLLQITPAVQGSPRGPYADASSFGNFAELSIDKVTQAGIMSGETVNGTSYFRPEAATTREAAAKVLYELLQQGELIN